MSPTPIIECDLTIAGRGMAGMAAAVFAVNRGISTAQVGVDGGIIFSSGLFDLLSTHPIATKNSWENPWAGIDALIGDMPGHPYARLKTADIHAAFEEILDFFTEAKYPYQRREGQNLEVITPLGTTKFTYCVPQSMWQGVLALEQKLPCLLVDFLEMNGFSARQIVSNLQQQWPGLRALSVPFPGAAKGSLIVGDVLARNLELPQNREKLSQEIRPHVGGAQAVGLPAVLGLSRSQEVIADLAEKIGVPVFEIPTFSLSIPGLRLVDVFDRELQRRGVRQFAQDRVLKVTREQDGTFIVGAGNKKIQYEIKSKGIVLATGRFWGRGLYADRKQIRESVFNLPVSQPAGRLEWHREQFLDPRGHAVNQAGLEIDDSFHPIDETGKPVFEKLFAAGSILAHQDWMRMKCGCGLAIATAYGAVNGFLN
ncbi:MAG: glycerol-3-phosphate dehydrogenase subunit GlpB [Deltaproteobacteria bacterium]|nr:glycerol-3-phosphate dehydrogenase subunit GlpB [Deltaproteobacteria bacterium]